MLASIKQEYCFHWNEWNSSYLSLEVKSGLEWCFVELTDSVMKKCFQLRNLIVLKYVARASGNGSFFNRKKERKKSLSFWKFSDTCGYSYTPQKNYYLGVSPAVMCRFFLRTPKPGGRVWPWQYLFVVVGPNSEAETLCTFICLATQGVFGGDSFLGKSLREKYMIMDELRPKDTQHNVTVSFKPRGEHNDLRCLLQQGDQ